MKKYDIESRRTGTSYIYKKMKANWDIHFMRRKCILNNVIKGQKEGRIGVTVRRQRRCKQLLDD